MSGQCEVWYLLVRVIAGVAYCACGRIDGAGRVKSSNDQPRGTDVQNRLGLSSGKEVGAVVVSCETATGAPGRSERKCLVVLTLFVVAERLYRTVEEASVHD